MRRALTAAILTLGVLAAFAPRADAVGLFGIWWDLDDADPNGYGAGFKGSRTLSQALSVDGRVSYVDFEDSDLAVIPLEATLIGKLGRFVYIGIGYGYYFFEGGNAPENDFGWYYLGGIEVPFSGVAVFGEVRWLKLSADSNQPLPGAPGSTHADSSVNLDSTTYHAGLSFSLPR